ncbi:o-succinylbenzoate--CoA ligase [Thermoflavimicrobium dichotomicum]|uniref:Fatty-acyl-CoA synthase n=1 Tax=Thermoflavimicrobium dichotomicum TaxID=46223 RepID=A0A1I3RYZ0_9BACL|nr:o-succinylbenzoate--CoA ligase [Thermoflavimicrobium dichotomicum]SFJ51538.1 fatty-acyl-CoA synthase [Thermoflavimicrobium dichotomicum]
MSWIPDWLTSRSRLTPERIAVVEAETGKRWSYQELNQHAEQLAFVLQEEGVKKGDRVAILAPNHLSYAELLFACAKIGAIFVPLNWRLALKELKMVVEDCTPHLLFYHPSFHEWAKRLPIQKKMDHQEWKKRNGMEMRWKREEPDIEDPWMILYTGGTTGKPKGVVLSHRAIFWNAINTILSWHLTADDKTLVYLPMFHTGGLNALATPLWYMGGTVVIGDQFEAEMAMEVIEREQCTIVLMVPTMYHRLIQSPAFERNSFSSMRVFLSGGAPCPLNIYDAFIKKGISFKEGYGMTEAGPNNFQIDPEVAKRKKGSVGLPMFFNEIRLMDGRVEVTEPEKVGEIWIRGGHLFGCYWNNPEATQAALQNGWFRTGDLGKRDQDGYYYIVGRQKDMIITGGENVYPTEVEQVILEHPDVEEVTVFGIPHEQWGEEVTAVIVLKERSTLTAKQLQNFIRKRLGGYKVPKKMVFVDELSKTAVGKIDKKELINRYGL